MMTLHFTKMTGAGNDFVMVDNRDGRYSSLLTRETIARVCDRHFGVGGDGLLAVETPEPDASAPFRMRYYNADGGEAEMCGNGARCFARFAASLTPVDGSFRFLTPAGVIGAELLGEEVRLGMSPPHSAQWEMPLTIDGSERVVHFINTGVPHAVLYVADLAVLEIERLGAALRFHEHFAPRGTNANFVEAISQQEIAIRTYERGVEGETLACGTGVVAAAITHAVVHEAVSPVRVRTKGGALLEVGFQAENGGWTNVTLTGPATFVFSGAMEI